MTTRRGFFQVTGAAAVGAALGRGTGLAATLGADTNRTRGADIVAAKPALRDPWSLARSGDIVGTGTPGPTWPKAELINFTAEVDGATARVWLPPPLEPTVPAKAMVFVARYPMTKLGFGYNEAGLFLHGTHDGREYMHCTWMVVDDDTALILGRDMLGFPKKMAIIDANIHDNAPSGRVVRKGLPVLEVLGSKVTAIDPTQAETPTQRPIVNVLGDPRGGGTLLQFGGEQTLHWARAVELEVSFGKSDLDPLYKLGMASSHRGTLVVVDMGIGGSEVQPEGEKSLTGTAVPAAWMAEAYPFRVW